MSGLNMKMDDINQSVIALTGFIPRALLDNEYWKIFGYKSRPKRGKIFRRFVDRSELAKEDFLEKELMILSMIDVIKAIKDKDTTEENKLLHLVGVLSNLFSPLQESGFFKDDLEYLTFIKEGVTDYSSGDITNAFSSREKKYLPKINAKKSLFFGFLMFVTLNREHLENGFTLDRKILAGYISLEDPIKKLNFSLGKDKIPVYTDFASQILRSV